MKKQLLVLAFLTLSFAVSPSAHANEVENALADYLELAPFSGGVISAEQIKTLDKSEVAFIDARMKSAYETSHIEGAQHIEWRQIINEIDKVPTDKTVVLYCDTGMVSSKAHMALQLMGFENVRVLLGGYDAWKAAQ
jgi:rhodanese-related sulfurtransferase